MRTFIQLHDNIGWAVVRSNDVPDHTNTPANITIVEVFTSEPEQFLKKKYNPETTSWSDVDLINKKNLFQSWSYWSNNYRGYSIRFKMD